MLFLPISALHPKFYPCNIKYMTAVKFFARLGLDRKISLFKVPSRLELASILPPQTPRTSPGEPPAPTRLRALNPADPRRNKDVAPEVVSAGYLLGATETSHYNHKKKDKRTKTVAP